MAASRLVSPSIGRDGDDRTIERWQTAIIFCYRELGMKLHQLAALVTASESGSLRQAAEKLRLSQPALSRSIRELESELGVKLLERTSLGVEPTDYGKALILRSKIVESELRRAKDDIAQL